MSDPGIFAFGLCVFLLLASGLSITLSEFRRMGDKEQNDAYPNSRPSRRQ